MTAESYLTVDTQSFRDLLRWIRFNRMEITGTRDGLPWKNLGVKLPEIATLRMLRAWPGMIPLLKAMGITSLQKKATRSQIRSSSGLFCISTSSTENAVIIEAGRLAMRAWLRLNQAGFAVQPLTLSSLFVTLARIGNLPEDTTGSWSRSFLEGDRILRGALALPETRFPIWMMRTGRMKPLPAEMRTLRRDVDRAIKDA